MFNHSRLEDCVETSTCCEGCKIFAIEGVHCFPIDCDVEFGVVIPLLGIVEYIDRDCKMRMVGDLDVLEIECSFLRFHERNVFAG